MAAKGNVALNDRALEVATFLTNALVRKVEPELQNIQTQIRKLDEAGVDQLEGGRGTEILNALDAAKKQVEVVRQNVEKIARFLDEKLGSVMEAIKDNDDIAATAEKARKAALQSKLQKQ